MNFVIKFCIVSTTLILSSLTFGKPSPKTCEALWDEIVTESSPLLPASLIQSIIVKRSGYSEPAFLNYLSENSEQSKDVLSKWYGKKKLNTWQAKLGVNFERLAPLFADPGIVSYDEDFINFVKAQPTKELSRLTLVEIRQKFSAALGDETYYRGIAATGFKAFDIKEKEGMDAPTYGQSNSVSEAVKQFNRGPVAEIVARLLVSPSFSMSVTKSPELAAAVTSQFKGPRQQTYVFKLRIPKLEVVDRLKLGLKVDGDDASVQVGKGYYDSNSIGKKSSPEVESFVFFTIKKEWIVDLKMVQDPPVFFLKP